MFFYIARFYPSRIRRPYTKSIICSIRLSTKYNMLIIQTGSCLSIRFQVVYLETTSGNIWTRIQPITLQLTTTTTLLNQIERTTGITASAVISDHCELTSPSVTLSSVAHCRYTNTIDESATLVSSDPISSDLPIFISIVQHSPSLLVVVVRASATSRPVVCVRVRERVHSGLPAVCPNLGPLTHPPTHLAPPVLLRGQPLHNSCTESTHSLTCVCASMRRVTRGIAEL